jgi:hypothetical protein
VSVLRKWSRHSVQNDNAGLTTESAEDTGKNPLRQAESKSEERFFDFASRREIGTHRFPEKDLGTLRSE